VTAAAAPLRHRGIDDQGALVGERPSALNPWLYFSNSSFLLYWWFLHWIKFKHEIFWIAKIFFDLGK
jgi:hypothetical protein